MKKFILATLATTLFPPAIFAGEIEYNVGIHSKPPMPAFNYCDVVKAQLEPKFDEMNKRLKWINEDVSLSGLRFDDVKYVVDSIPGIALEKTPNKTRHYKVLSVQVYPHKRSTLHTTRLTLRQMDSGVDYKKQLRKLLTMANPKGLDDFIENLKWKYMSGGCKSIQINPNKLLPWQ